MQQERLILIGYRGTGKSTVGRHLAAALGWDFVDADAVVEHTAGKSIAEIFATDGEQSFRDLESALLAQLANRIVLATGGGVVLRPENRVRLHAAGYRAWLTASPQTIWRRLQDDSTTAARRPALTTGGFEEVLQLLAVREPLYREVADREFPTDGRSPEQVATAILAEYRRHHPTT